MTAPAGLNERVHLDFKGTPLQYLGWLLLSIAGAVLIVPLAWVIAAAAQWVCRNTTFSDGTTVEFRGTGGEIAVWSVFYILIAAGQQFLMREVQSEGILAVLAAFLTTYALMLYISLTILKWFVYNTKIDPGPQMSFTGSYLSLLGRYLLVFALVYTIVGWAWGLAAMYRWIAENVKGRGLRFEFHGKGHEILWRVLATVLGSVVIVTIPFLAIWLSRWLIQNVTMTHVEENEWLSEPNSEPRSKRKPSSPTPHSPVLPIE
jgi:hypothetical protein